MNAPAEDKSYSIRKKFYKELEKVFSQFPKYRRTFFCEVLLQNPRKTTFLHEIFGAFLFMNIDFFWVKESKFYHIKI